MTCSTPVRAFAPTRALLGLAACAEAKPWRATPCLLLSQTRAIFFSISISISLACHTRTVVVEAVCSGERVCSDGRCSVDGACSRDLGIASGPTVSDNARPELTMNSTDVIGSQVS
jgi:hypothetical protein